METTIVSNVWAMSGWIVSYTPGILSLSEGEVSFFTAGGEQFRVPVSEIKNVKWPKLQMGYGVHMDANGKTYKFTFMQPNGQSPLDSGMGTAFGRIATGLSALKSLSNMKEYKTAAKQWREVVGG